MIYLLGSIWLQQISTRRASSFLEVELDTRHSLVGTLERDVPVWLDLSQYSQRRVDLLYSWIEIWLFKNCKSGWSLDLHQSDTESRILLAIHFSDVREALYFKLSPLLVNNQNSVIHRFQRMNLFF